MKALQADLIASRFLPENRSLWDELEEHTLPIEYSPEFVRDLPNFKRVPENLVSPFNAGYFYDHMIAKLPKEENIKLFLLAATEEGYTFVKARHRYRKIGQI